jgi:hypothetical protein
LDYLKNIVTHSHVLVYDWTEERDISSLIEDIEELNFDYEKDSTKMADWKFNNVQELRTKRQYCENRYFLHLDYTRNDYDVPELHYTAEEVEERDLAMKMVCTYKINLFIIESCEMYTHHQLLFNYTLWFINKITKQKVKKKYVIVKL